MSNNNKTPAPVVKREVFSFPIFEGNLEVSFDKIEMNITVRKKTSDGMPMDKRYYMTRAEARRLAERIILNLENHDSGKKPE